MTSRDRSGPIVTPGTTQVFQTKGGEGQRIRYGLMNELTDGRMDGRMERAREKGIL